MRGGIEFEAQGVTRVLRYSMNAMTRYQEAASETFIDALEATQAKPTDFIRARMLFWAGIEGISLTEAGDIIDDIGIKEAYALMNRAAEAALPKAEASSVGNGRKAKAS